MSIPSGLIRLSLLRNLPGHRSCSALRSPAQSPVPGNSDQYTFSANAGDALIARIGATWQYYPRLRLYAPNGTLLSTCVADYRCELTTTAPVTGTYLLTVSDENGDNTGTYTLFTQRPNNPANTTPLTFGVPVNAGTSTNGADLDTYTFSGTAGESTAGPDAGTGYTTKLRLYAPNGTLIQQAAEGVFSDISLTLPATGTYVLIASDNAVNTIRSLYPSGRSHLRPPSLPPRSRLGLRLPARLPVPGNSINTRSLPMPVIHSSPVSDPTGDTIPFFGSMLPITRSLHSCSAYAQCEFVTTVSATGTYLLTVSDEMATLPGRIRYLSSGPTIPPTPHPLTFGVPVMPELSTNGAELDTYTFSGTSGNSLLIQMQATGYTSKLRLYAPNGTLLQQAAEGVFSDISLTLPATGTYVLMASNNDVDQHRVLHLGHYYGIDRNTDPNHLRELYQRNYSPPCLLYNIYVQRYIQ